MPICLLRRLSRSCRKMPRSRCDLPYLAVAKSVILRVGSPRDGARRFPLLARAGPYSWAGFAAFRAAAAGVWLAGRSVSRAADEVGSLQVAGAGGAGSLQEAILQTR